MLGYDSDRRDSWTSSTGEKLIEHLKKWLDTTKLLETPHSWEPGQESDIAAAILELFHLLPQQAHKFLETQGVSSVLTNTSGPTAELNDVTCTCLKTHLRTFAAPDHQECAARRRENTRML